MNGERVVTMVVLLLVACGGSDDDGAGSVDAGDDPGADAGGSGERVTEFVPNRSGWIELVEDANVGTYTTAWLRTGGDLPPATLLAVGGECEIWTHDEPALCDPPCEDGVCVSEGECAPFPQLASAGTITVTGLTEDLSFTTGEFGYEPDPAFPPEDLFAAGAAIAATAPGDDLLAFSLEATGVPTLEADLDLEFDINLVIEDGVDREIRWTAEGTGTIQLGLQVGWHGAVYEALMLCETEDDGTFTIPGDLITQFPRASNGMEQHSSWFARLTRDTVDTDGGPIELVVSSQVRIPQLSHP